MRITEVSTRIISVPLERPIRTPIHYIVNVDNVLVELHTDEGITGIAYLWCFGTQRAQALAALVKDMVSLVGGMDALARASVYARMEREANFLGKVGAVTIAMSAIDTALWDIAGKALNRPVWQLLGGESRSIPAYAGGLFLSDSIDVIVAEAKAYAASGFRAIKMRCGAKDWRDDIARVEAVRDAVGPNFTLMVDVVQGWTVDRAIKVGRELERFDLFYIEDPVVFDDLDGMAHVAAVLDTPIAAGENDYGLRGFRRLLEGNVVDIPMMDLQRVGGISAWMQVAAMATAWGKPVVPHVFPEISIHMLAATPSALFIEYVSWWEVLFVDTPKLVDGGMRPFDTPGLGLAFDFDAVERFRVA
jgi:L-alanine-DL-glutamate epimerase-like enolase superfamily enzyme